MKNGLKIQLFLIIIFTISLLHATSSLRQSPIYVAQTIGYSISHEKPNLKNKIIIDINNVNNILNNYLKDRGFGFKFALILEEQKNGNKFYVEGLIIHTDGFGRSIETKFKTLYRFNNRKIIIENIHLENFAKPNGQLFIVRANQLDPSTLGRLTFNKALKKVNSLARKLNSFEIAPDNKQTNYRLLVFIMNKLDKDDNVYAVFSDYPFNQKGNIGDKIKTKDGWTILNINAKFAYNGPLAKYINIFWQKDGYLIPIESYSTQSLVKSIQKALQQRGYTIDTNGKLDNATKKAIQSYLVRSGFNKNSKISESLLWFMRKYNISNVSKIVQASLVENGIKIGKIDGKIGLATKRGIKKFQKRMGTKETGVITPDLVKILIKTSKNIAMYGRLKSYFSTPAKLNSFHDKIWLNEL